VAWLVDRQLRAARQLNRGEQPPALISGWLGDSDAPGSQILQHLFDVVAHQEEFVLARPVRGMHSDFGWWQLEYQPATAGVDPCKSEHVTDEDPISLRVGTVDNDMCSVDQVSFSLFWSSTLSLISVLILAHQDNILVLLRDPITETHTSPFIILLKLFNKVPLKMSAI